MGGGCAITDVGACTCCGGGVMHCGRCMGGGGSGGGGKRALIRRETGGTAIGRRSDGM